MNNSVRPIKLSADMCVMDKMPDGFLFAHTRGAPGFVIEMPSPPLLRVVGWMVVGIMSAVIVAAPVEILFNASLWPVFKFLLAGGAALSALMLYGVFVPNRGDSKLARTNYYYVTNDGRGYRWNYSSMPPDDSMGQQRLYKKYGWWKTSLADLPVIVRKNLGETKPELLLLG